jgi:hypothetical protein
MADEMFPVRDVVLAQVDAETVSWPASVRDAAFGDYLEARPSVDLHEFHREICGVY